ncbi:MAG: flagellar hook-length control protein FliK [Sphingobium sp.]
MTQIAATTASIGGKGVHAGKGHGAHAGKGTDFVALAAGLGLPTGEGETPDADALATGEGAGTDTDAGMDGKEAGDTVVVDLALGAAAQSAVADIVAVQPQAVTPPVTPPATSETGKATDAIALDGRAAGRSSWRMVQDVATVTTEAGTDTTQAVLPEAAMTPALATDLTAMTPKKGKPTEPAADTPAVAVQDATPQQAAAPRALRTGVQTGAAFRQAAREATQPAKTAAANDTATDAVATPQAAPIFSVLPQAVRDPKPLIPTAAAQPVEGEATDPAQLAALQATMAASDTAPALPATDKGSKPVAAPPFRPADPAQRTTAEEVVTDAESTAAATTGAPVMSALHRAASTAGETHKAQSGTSTPATTDIVRTGAEQAQHRGKDGHQEKGQDTPLPRAGDDRATPVQDNSVPSGSQYSDILQSLPPIAQSRLGLVTDASPVVTGPGDVGATLQGQAIDMGVDGQWIDRMAQEITALASGAGHSRFQLSPPNLGRIQIDIQHGENGGQVQLLTETDEAAKRLMDGKADLQADARLASLSLSSITIERSSAGFDSGRDQGAQQNGQQNSQQTPQRHQQGSEQAAQGNQMGTQTGAQSDGRNGGQAAQNLGAQGNGQGQQNNGGQGKSSTNRDVLNDRAGTGAQDGSVRRDGDRLVRYA